MRRLFLTLLLWALSVPLQAQNGPEVDALLDAFFAKDLTSLSRHLPPELAEVIKDLPADARQELASRYLLGEQGKREGNTYSFPDDGAVIRVDPRYRNDEASPSVSLYLEKRMYNGNEAVLRFRPQIAGPDRPWQEHQRLTVWMKYVDDSWRIYELDFYDREIRLDDPDYISYLKRPRPSPNEESAVGSLRTINTAAVTYSSAFPDLGFPESLAVLGVPSSQPGAEENAEPNPEHAGLIDSVLSSPPFEKDGYRFSYQKLSLTEYSATARPVKFGSTGTKSFFTDQSGVIRSTDEDRDPTREDDPVQ